MYVHEYCVYVCLLFICMVTWCTCAECISAFRAEKIFRFARQYFTKTETQACKLESHLHRWPAIIPMVHLTLTLTRAMKLKNGSRVYAKQLHPVGSCSRCVQLKFCVGGGWQFYRTRTISNITVLKKGIMSEEEGACLHSVQPALVARP